MEYLIFFAAIGLFLLFIYVKGSLDYRRAEKRFVRSLYEDYGKLPEKEYKPGSFDSIAGYYQKHPREGQTDDITWNDLNMDEIYKRMNFALSSAGEEYLYYTLRTPVTDLEILEHREKLTEYFASHADERVQLQLLLRKLGGTGKYSLYKYLDNLELLGERSNKKHFLLLAGFPVLGAVCFLQLSVGLLGIVALAIYNITSYFREKKEIEPYVVSFAYVMRLLEACDGFLKISPDICGQEADLIRTHRAALNRMRRDSFWVMSGAGVTMSGNPLDMIMDYVRMIFHVDLMVFNKMLSELRRHIGDVDVLAEQLGGLETAVCIGAYRASLENGWCRPEFTDKCGLAMENGYHPMIARPVKNSIRADRGVLLTGSNASGKSTFLKTVALNAILAQTIHTCAAEAYRTAFFRIYSSMSLRDDIESGESYYIVEIKSLKRILDASRRDGQQVLCFVDEVLRGTNTVERIAASTQILKSLTGGGLLCFAATHDIELTDLLKGLYKNCHFEEDIRDGDVFFNYRLQEGKASTRNAIKLLEIMGYDSRIIDNASEQARKFVETGAWELA